MTVFTRAEDMRVPMDFNGYAPVARPAVRVRASEIREGDVLILDGYVSKVTQVEDREFFPGADPAQRPRRWPVLHIHGALNIVRFPNEIVSVIRPD